MTISKILSQKGTAVHTARSTMTVEEAIKTMWELEISALVVCDDGRRIDGIVSDRGIIRALASQGTEIMGRPLADIMTREVITCRPTDRINNIMAQMTERRIRHFPVVDGEGMLMALVSIGDVVKHRIDEIANDAEHMRDYISNAR
ncbi:CBS domain-containing protein [Caenispirillum salinarum]|uniref:CBS domain-containing protein n=1 Tax=Caenispirillum salinarum TaxID=859058 RepID=UPI00384AABE0